METRRLLGSSLLAKMVPSQVGTIFANKDEPSRRRVSILCHLEEVRSVEDLSSGIAHVSVPRGRGNCHDQRNRCAILMVESGNAGTIVADPNRARRRDRHAPWIDKIWIDVLCNAGDI